jgi:hypothetical protein
MSVTLPYQSKLSVKSSFSSQPRHRTVEFGDGYIQRTPWGPYAGRRTISVVHEHLTQEEADWLISFYEGNFDTAEAISISDNYLLGNAGKFYLQSYDVEMTTPEYRTVSASMIEVFGE